MVRPLFFLGKSGVGKTTIMEAMVELDSRFVMPRITVTRTKRDDDRKSSFQYVCFTDYVRMEDGGAFILSMKDGQNCYGYQRGDLVTEHGYKNLLYGSPMFLSQIKKIGLVILIDGDDRLGLTLRGVPDRVNRIIKNSILEKKYYGDPYFRKQVEIIIVNDFKEPKYLAEQIIERISLII